jgi:hypothetical protein
LAWSLPTNVGRFLPYDETKQWTTTNKELLLPYDETKQWTTMNETMRKYWRAPEIRFPAI